MDARADLFSFGVVLYEMVTGFVPFRGESIGVVAEAILNRTPVAPVRLNPGTPPRLEDIIHKALEKDRELRYQSAAEMRSDLKRLRRDRDSGRSAAMSVEVTAAATGSGTAWAEVATPKTVAGERRTWIAAGAVVLLSGRPHPAALSPGRSGTRFHRQGMGWIQFRGLGCGWCVALGFESVTHQFDPAQRGPGR